MTLSPKEIARQMAQQYSGVDPERVTALLGGSTGVLVNLAGPAAEFVKVERREIAFPIRFTLPWSALVSENRRFCVGRGAIRMTAMYKEARGKVKAIAREAMSVDGIPCAPIAVPLSLHARVYFPDKRVRDVINFAGATLNALKGVVFQDDVWIYRSTWERIDTDVDAPRAEITIAAYKISLS